MNLTLNNILTINKKRIFIAIILGLLAYGSTFVLGPNNAVEEGAESMLQQETGMAVDFTPKSK